MRWTVLDNDPVVHGQDPIGDLANTKPKTKPRTSDDAAMINVLRKPSVNNAGITTKI
jgi:hypothetical protein